MRFALGMSNREIARALGRSDGATKVLIHRAIKQLEELMAMSEHAGELEPRSLLHDALRPIEPPEDLATRMESTLSSIAEQAAAELSSWADELAEGELSRCAIRATGSSRGRGRGWRRGGGALVVVETRVAVAPAASATRPAAGSGNSAARR